MSGEIRSTADDPELRAMLAITRYFDGLDRTQRNRVLEWAKGRFVSAPIADLPIDWHDRFIDGMAQAAKTVGGVTPLDMIRFAEEVARHRDEQASEVPT